MNVTSYEDELRKAKTITQIFKLVKRLVEESLGLRRAGVEIALASLPPNYEALTDPASNYIILNQNTLHALQQLIENEVEIKSYIFRRLLEEYLKALGIEKDEAAHLTRRLIRQSFQRNHAIQKYMNASIVELYPEITLAPQQRSRGTTIHIITEETDNDTPQYIA